MLQYVPISKAPRVINVPVTTGTGARTATGTCDTVTKVRLSPFEPGQSVLALSPGASAVYGVPAPYGDQTRHVTFQIAAADITAAANKVGQVAATGGRSDASKVQTDLTVSLGIITTGELPIGQLPAGATSIEADDMLSAILLVNGVPYTRILDASSPAPAAGEWCLDSDDKTVLVIGADSTTPLPVGAQIDILKPNTALIKLLSKPGSVAGAALVAGVAEERMLAVPVSTTDTAGRTGNRDASVDFIAANVAAAVLTGLSK